MNETSEAVDSMSQCFAAVVQGIERAAQRAGRDPRTIQILAASKKQPPTLVNRYLECCLEHGRSALLGENYVQDFKRKRQEIRGDFCAHMIGSLQSNKAREAVELFHVIETLQSQKVASAVEQAAAALGRSQPVYLQVNVSGDPAKSGLALAAVPEFCAWLRAHCPHLAMCGLMTITRLYDRPDQARPDYRSLRELRDGLAGQYDTPLELSMGMSDDFEVAVEEGATIVRIGTALFGERPSLR